MDVYIHVCGLNVTGNCRDGSYVIVISRVQVL